MNDIQRYSQLVEQPHNLIKSRKGCWCRYSDTEPLEKHITKLEETNRLLCCELDEAQKVVEARDERIEELKRALAGISDNA